MMMRKRLRCLFYLSLIVTPVIVWVASLLSWDRQQDESKGEQRDQQDLPNATEGGGRSAYHYFPLLTSSPG